jgi:protein gp37
MMAENSGIEWTDHTFNPWWGCQKVSPGCSNCYAETLSKRFGKNIWGPPHATDRRIFGDKHWHEPVKWNARAQREGRRSRVFCASMADVFEDHPQVGRERRRLFELIEATPHLDWQLLTKRPENVRGMVPELWNLRGWPINVWIGTSVEDQQRADERIPALIDTPATVRFLSCEPLLGAVDLTRWLDARWRCSGCGEFWSGPHQDVCPSCARTGYWTGSVPRLHWVIVGGESGPAARPMHTSWPESLRVQCQDAGVPYFFKQHGAWAPVMSAEATHAVELDGTVVNIARGSQCAQPIAKVGKHAAGRELDGRTWDEMPTPAEVLS